MAVWKDGQAVGHLPREIATTYWYFLRRRNSRTVCKITGHRHLSEIVGKDWLFHASTLLRASRIISRNLSWYSPTNCRYILYKLLQTSFFQSHYTVTKDFSLYTLVLEVSSTQLGTEHAQCCRGGLILEIKCLSARKT